MLHPLTANDIISALTTDADEQLLDDDTPTFLRDVLRLKRERGDADCQAFRTIAVTEFATGLNATIIGACIGMKRWLDRGRVQRTPPAEAFLADCEAVRDGRFKARSA